MNTNPKLLFYSLLLEFLKTPLADESRLTLKATYTRKLLLRHSKHVSFEVPEMEELEKEYDNIHGYTRPRPGDLIKEAASAAFKDLSAQLRCHQVCMLIDGYLELIGDPLLMLGHIMSAKELGAGTAGKKFVEVKIRITDLDSFKHLIGAIIPMQKKHPWSTSAV